GFVLLTLSCFYLIFTGWRLLQAEQMPPVTKDEIQKAISKFLPQQSQLLPLPGHKQPFIRQDLDGDGVQEGIAYFQKGNRYEILIVKRNEQLEWEKWNQIPL